MVTQALKALSEYYTFSLPHDAENTFSLTVRTN